MIIIAIVFVGLTFLLIQTYKNYHHFTNNQYIIFDVTLSNSRYLMFMETPNVQIKVVGKIQLSEEDLKKKRFVTGKSQYAHIANVNKADYDNVSEDSVNVLYKNKDTRDEAPDWLQKVLDNYEKHYRVRLQIPRWNDIASKYV